MQIPISMSEISLFIAALAIILLVTSELIHINSESFGSIAIDKSRLRLAAIAVGALFMFTVLLRVINPSIF